MKFNYPRIVISGTSSGCGKTTITCGILYALKRRGIDVASFKCGPDYIDPMFHEEVIGTPSNNLDSFFLDDNGLIDVFCRNAGKDISVIEGVMGYYDGITSLDLKGSTFDIATILKANTVLIINCKGMSSSILAIIKGFVEYQKESLIKGIILNNITKKVYDSLKPKIEEMFKGISVLGYVPKLDQSCLLESRHLGLVTAKEIEGIKEKLENIANILDETIDFNNLLEIASIKSLDYRKRDIKKIGNVKIAVAKDKAFCFYYHENLTLLEKLGAELVYFSPLDDSHLPSNINGIYLGGGYPELYLNKLHENVSLRNEIKELLNHNMPCIAECGGFMYLNKVIDGVEMVGFFDGEVTNMHKLVRFGYVTLVANHDNLLCKEHEIIKGHEFHYYDVIDNGNGFTATKTNGTSYECVKSSSSYYAGYPHLYFNSNINFVINFINKCMEWKNND